MAACMGWKIGRRVPVTLGAFTVKLGTELQLRPLYALRKSYQVDFVDEFAPLLDRGNPDAMAVHLGAVNAAQRQLWRVRWDNSYKEVYWRLILNGLACGERLHQDAGECVCGPRPSGLPAGRHHHYWDCPVAQSVSEAMMQQLSGGWCVGALRPYHVLLMERPRGVSTARTLHKGVWQVVCLAAINAMDLGRRAACQLGVQQKKQHAAAAAAITAAAPQWGQLRITDIFQPAPLTPSQQQHQQQVRQRQQLLLQQQQQQQQEAAATQLAEVQQQAVSYFWELLEDFVALEAAPKSWFPQVPPSHPFLCVSGDSTLSVHRVVTEPAVD